MRRTFDLQPSLFFSVSFDSVYGMVDVLSSLFTLCADVDPPGKTVCGVTRYHIGEQQSFTAE